MKRELVLFQETPKPNKEHEQEMWTVTIDGLVEESARPAVYGTFAGFKQVWRNVKGEVVGWALFSTLRGFTRGYVFGEFMVESGLWCKK